MRTNKELETMPNLLVRIFTDEGGFGEIIYGKLKASVIWSRGAGWEHISIAPYKRSQVPTWEEMCKVKDMFFYPEEAAIQIHPPKDDYVNNVDNCLHLWRPINVPLPLPHPILVGIKDNMTEEDIGRAFEEVYEKPYVWVSNDGKSFEMPEMKKNQ